MAIIIFLLILLLSGCGLFDSRTLRLATRNADLLAYVEAFNASQDRYKVEAVYTATPEEVLIGKGEPADIIFGEYFACPAYMQKCVSLDDLFGSKKVRRDLFYPDLLKLGVYEKSQRLFPYSFDLPCILFAKNANFQGLTDLVIHLDSMKIESMAYNSDKGSKLVRMGFSPFWNDDFLYTEALLFGSDFRNGNNRQLLWEPEGLQESLQFLSSWVAAIPGGYEAERLFSKKYLNIPPYQLIKEKKILFSFISSRELYKIPQEKFEYTDFRWLSHENKIVCNDDITFIALPQRSRNKNGAKFFIAWILNPLIQEKLMEINHFKRLDGVFGLTGGFSSLKEVNISKVPQHYPLFVNRIPASETIVFPRTFPDNIVRIKNEIIKPWMIEAVTTDNFSKKLEDQLNFFQE